MRCVWVIFECTNWWVKKQCLIVGRRYLLHGRPYVVIVKRYICFYSKWTLIYSFKISWGGNRAGLPKYLLIFFRCCHQLSFIIKRQNEIVGRCELRKATFVRLLPIQRSEYLISFFSKFGRSRSLPVLSIIKNFNDCWETLMAVDILLISSNVVSETYV